MVPLGFQPPATEDRTWRPIEVKCARPATQDRARLDTIPIDALSPTTGDRQPQGLAPRASGKPEAR